MPHLLFDVDDLSFFNASVYGLRHVSLEQGKREAERGAARGDSVCLANFGLSQKVYNADALHSDILIHPDNCEAFQRKVEDFIQKSFALWHVASERYNDVAFMLLRYKRDALPPYDFARYPLGKYGSHGFSADQVVRLISTEHFENHNLNHAVVNAMLALRDELHDQKLKAIADMIAAHPEEKELLEDIQELYQQKTFIDKPLFALFSRYVNPAFESEKEDLFARITETIKESKFSQDTKGNKTLTVSYTPFDAHSATEAALKQQVYEAIKYHNMDELELCLSKLPVTVFDDGSENPISFATKLLGKISHQAVYMLHAFNPTLYDRARMEPETPIYNAAFLGDLALIKFFEGIHPLTENDLTAPDRGHILKRPVQTSTKAARDVIEHLTQSDLLHIKASLDDNPVMECMNGHYDGDYAKEIRMLILKKTSLDAKYQGLMAAATEYFYAYDERDDFSERAEQNEYYTEIAKNLAVLFASLTEAEYVEMRACFDEDKDNDLMQKAFIAELFHYALETILVEDASAAQCAIQIFADLCPEPHRERLQAVKEKLSLKNSEATVSPSGEQHRFFRVNHALQDFGTANNMPSCMII